MFDIVARANIHQDQVINLLKQRSRVHSSLIYSDERITTIETNLCAHIYALVDADQETLKPDVKVLVKAFNIITEECINSDCFITHLIECYEQACCITKANEKENIEEDQQENTEEKDEELAKALVFICSVLPTEFFTQNITTPFESSYLENLLHRNNVLLELLIHMKITWPVEQLRFVRQSVLSNQLTPSLKVACLLFGQKNITTQELAQGYTHTEFTLVKASFVQGLVSDKKNAQTALFNRFAKTTNIEEKAELLTLAGLSGDSRWSEPCAIFCKEYPEYTFTTLSSFQHKVFLTTIIELMGTAQTADDAYDAWLLLTNAELQKQSQLQDSKNKHNQAGDINIPNNNQAELVRQQLMQQPGALVLQGISFDVDNANSKLIGLQGKAVQHALLLTSSMTDGMALYSQQLTAKAFIALQGAQRAA